MRHTSLKRKLAALIDVDQHGGTCQREARTICSKSPACWLRPQPRNSVLLSDAVYRDSIVSSWPLGLVSPISAY
jgi:hypothetical protein